MASSSANGSHEERRFTLKSQSRVFVHRLHEYFCREKNNGGPLKTLNQVNDRVADALHISRKTVSRILKQVKNSNERITTPGKKRPRNSPKTDVDSFDEVAIQNHIYNYYLRKEWPTRSKLISSLKEAGLFDGGKTSLSKILEQLNFTWKKINNRKFLLERSDIAAARCHFLRLIREVDFNKIIFLDETWVNCGHCLTKSWSDDTQKSCRKLPTGKGGRLIITHAGSADGFVPNGLLMFRSRKTVDYHEEMNAEVFTNWFLQLLDKIPPHSTIVMDNAPYHSVEINKSPTTAWRKDEIQKWLTENGIDWPRSSLKAELIDLVRQHKPRVKKYFLDEKAKEKGHRVIRLPPYHCEYNPIELIWAQVKGKVARENVSFKFDDVERLTREAVESVTSEAWKNAVRHVRDVIVEAWEKEGILETNLEQMIINTADSSSDCETDSDDYESSDSELEGISVLPPMN